MNWVRQEASSYSYVAVKKEKKKKNLKQETLVGGYDAEWEKVEE